MDYAISLQVLVFSMAAGAAGYTFFLFMGANFVIFVKKCKIFGRKMYS